MPIGPIPPVTHIKRHTTTGSHPNDRRMHHHEHVPNNDSNNSSSQSNNYNGFANRGWKRPCMCFHFLFVLFYLMIYLFFLENAI